MEHGDWTGLEIDADGWCVYLERGVGCTIQKTKPKVCKDYDCRDDIDNVNICHTVRDAAKKRSLECED